MDVCSYESKQDRDYESKQESYTFDRTKRIQRWLQEWKADPERFHAHCFNLWVLIEDPDLTHPFVFAKILDPQQFKLKVADADWTNVLTDEEIE